MTTQSFNPLYPMLIHKYEEFIPDQNASVIDKINSIIQTLNQVGTLTNDVVKDWNTVYQWCMNDGLQTDVNNKIDEELAKGTFDAILTSLFTPVVGDLTTLQTADKGNLVAAINDLQAEADSNKNLIGDLTTLTTTDKGNLVAAVNDNVASLAENSSRISNINVDVKVDYNAKGDGSAFDDSFIQNALNSGKFNILIPDGTYLINSTLTVPANVKLTLSHKAILKLNADVNAIQLKNNSSISGGTIDASGLASFTHACIYLNASDFSDDPYTRIKNIYLKGTGLLGSRSNSGYGIYFYAAQPSPSSARAWINFVNADDIFMFGLERGVYFQTATGGSGNCWITGNNFHNLIIDQCTYGIYLNEASSSTASIGGNRFTNLQYQCNSTFTNTGVYIMGNNNVVEGEIWDAQTLTSGEYAIQFGSGSYNNVVRSNIPREYPAYKDQGTGNRVASTQNDVSITQMIFPPVGFSKSKQFVGDQDDYLAYAGSRYTITQTSGPTTSGLSGMFDPRGSYYARWSGVTSANPVVLLLDLHTDPLKNATAFGILSGFSEFPVNLKIETSQDNVAWTSQFNTTQNSSNSFVMSPLDWQDSSTSYIRITFSQSNNADGYITISRIFACSSDNMGMTWLARNGGTLYGNLNMGSNYLTVGNVASLPTASATYRGQIIYVQGNGTTTADTAYQCLMSATGTYSWKQIIAG